MTLYDDLGVPHDSDAAAIKAAHRDGVKRHHPDKPDGDREAFDRVQRAYVVLSNPAKRAKYDATGDTSDEPDNRAAEAMAIAADIYGRTLELAIAGGMLGKDIVAASIKNLASEAQVGRNDRRKSYDRLARVKEAADRLLFDGEASALRGYLQQEIEHLDSMIAAATARLELMEMARVHLEAHRWRVDQGPIAQPQRPTNSYRDFVSMDVA